jgi:molybdopterin synthase catalytic subunit
MPVGQAEKPEKCMDFHQRIEAMKQEPAFKEQVGMILIHNGVARGRSREDNRAVGRLEVRPDYAVIEDIRHTFESKPGIFRILIEAREGTFQPGDDLLFIAVAGDIREHVKPVLEEVLEAIKTRAMHKSELPPE